MFETAKATFRKKMHFLNIGLAPFHTTSELEVVSLVVIGLNFEQ